MSQKKSQSPWPSILVGGLVLLAAICMCVGWSSSFRSGNEAKRKRLEENSVRGTIVGLAFAGGPTDSVSVVGSKAAGAMGGALLGHLFFGPVGAVVGAGLGAGGDAKTVRRPCGSNDILVLVVVQGADTVLVGVSDQQEDDWDLRWVANHHPPSTRLLAATIRLKDTVRILVDDRVEGSPLFVSPALVIVSRAKV